MLRFIISKGWEGFSDRLQCLSYCVNIATKYNRVLYVDWTDDIWDTGFYKYFYFEGLEYIDKLELIPKTFSVYPKFWQHKLMLPANQWIYNQKDELVFDPKTTDDCSDVWVNPGIGYREYNMPKLVKHLRVQPYMIEQLYTEPIVDKPVVHLRGTDRSFTDTDWQRCRQLAPTAYIVSDDTKLIDRWKSESPDSIVLSTPIPNTTHFTVGIDKHEQNVKLLREFFILGSANEAYALNQDSLYFKMSRMLCKSPGYKNMFGKTNS